MTKTHCWTSRYIILFIIPLLIGLLSFKLKEAAGPFWLGVNNDPAYMYLMNALYLADHKAPKYIDHPGVTLEIIGAGVIKVLNFPVNSPVMVKNVLTSPEYYLHVLYY